MELLEALYRRKPRKKQKKVELGRSDGALCRAPSEASVNNLTTGLISRVLRFTSRRSKSASRPHSWHSTKLGDGQPEFDPAAMDEMSSAWRHDNYHASASTTDLSGGFDSGGCYLRKSPDQYSSRGSMESLDPPQSSRLHSTVQSQHHHHHHHHSHSGSHPAYSSCQHLSSARSSNSIDHLHSKRDSAYSSFSTTSSTQDYFASTPSFSPERSYSLETVSQRGGGSAEMLQMNSPYVSAVYDAQQGLSQEHKISSSSAALLSNSDSRGGVRSGLARDLQVGGVCYRSNSSINANGSNSSSVVASNRHSVGPIWGPAASHNSYESLKGAPAPPRRSDSYAAIRNHERPNSWSSLEHARSLRSLQKSSWHPSSGSVASAKGLFGPDGQLHTVIEKSPESSPTTKPRQGVGFSQPPSPTRPSSGPAGPPTPSSRVILPAGVYPVPRPEPHFTQTHSPSPGLSGVYPPPAKESSRHQGVNGRDEAVTEGWRDERISAAENGLQSNTSSPCLHSSSSSQLRTRTLEADSHLQQQDLNAGTHKPHIKTAGGEPDSQIGHQKTPNHQGSFNQNFQGSQFQTQNQELRITSVYSGPDLRTALSQEKNDPRSRDQTIVYSEPAASSRFAQGQVRPTCPSPVQPQPQAPPTSTSQRSPRHFSDSAAPQYHHCNHREQDKDSEHPLTRLENALAEVQRCTSPDSVFYGSSHDDSSFSELTQAPTRSLSVAEKVNRFERRERGGKQRSQSINIKPTHLLMTDKSRCDPRGAEDVRNMLERSTKVFKTHRRMSDKGGSSAYMKHRTPADPISVLQRSLSSFQLDGSNEGNSSKDFPWKQELQQITDPLQDLSSNRPPSSAASPVTSSSSQQPPSTPAKNQSLEKKGPKTKPKPQGFIVTAQSLVTSPHTPKERHVVSPDIQGQGPPPLPSVPPVGPPLLTRICGRKRLTADQKKRSYSEPENINEVGVSDPETAALFRREETSVADRRKMFELAAIRVGKGTFQNAMSRSDQRQARHDALAEYVERKRGVKREEGGQRSISRPHSAYLQLENSSHSDTFSLSSTSSLLSLQESTTDQSFHSGERRLCPTLPPGGDLRSFQSNVFYPGKVTTPRPPAQPTPSSSSGSALELDTQVCQDLNPEAFISRRSQLHCRDSSQDLDLQTAEPQLKRGLSKKLNEALQRAGSSRRSGRSASAEDLLERLEIQPSSTRHHRSLSSPTVEKRNQDFAPSDVKMFGVSYVEPGRCALAADRPADIVTPGDLVSPQTSRYTESTPQPAGPSQDLFHTPATRQRNSERQRAHNTSTLAASVGLPCPFSPDGTPDGGTAEWTVSERLSQTNLDSIAFSDIPQTSTSDRTADSLSNVPTDDMKDEYRNRAFSLETTGRSSAGNTISPVTSTLPPNRKSRRSSSSPPPSSDPTVHQRLSSLRISESSLCGSFDQQQLKALMAKTREDTDEVFFQHPPPPPPPSPPPSPPFEETNITEDFLPPPPSPPPPLEAEHHSAQSFSSEFVNNSISTRKSLSQPSPPPLSSTASAEDDVVFEYQPLPRREKTSEELRVEVLARRLVLQDPTLAPLLDTWGGKSTMELMEEVFSNSRLTDESQHRGRKHPDEWIQDETFSPAQSSATDQRKDLNLDDEETNLNIKKVALCEALRSSVVALQQEKQELSEELRHHRALGSSIEALVQDQLKPNEKEKYSVFVGDLERIVNLLLSLCSRLSRIDRSLLSLQRDELMTEDAAEEKDSLHHKRSLLLRQTEDARELKENLDRRQQVVQTILLGYLTEPQLQDYRRFVSAKPSLLIRQRHLDDLIRQGEEQLTQLAESLPAELAEACGWSMMGRLSSSTSCSSLDTPSLISGPAHSIRSTTVTSL